MLNDKITGDLNIRENTVVSLVICPVIPGHVSNTSWKTYSVASPRLFLLFWKNILGINVFFIYKFFHKYDDIGRVLSISDDAFLIIYNYTDIAYLELFN